jgi:hypothetical protein
VKNEKNSLVELSRAQADPFLCDPIQVEIMRDDDEPFHGQDSAKLQRQADTECKRSPSKYAKADHPNVNDAAKPGDGMSGKSASKR